MTKKPKYWHLAAIMLDMGAHQEGAISQMMITSPGITRREAITALEYARSQGAGREFERLHITHKGF